MKRIRTRSRLTVMILMVIAMIPLMMMVTTMLMRSRT